MSTTTFPSAHPIDTSGHDPLTTVFGAESATYRCPDLAAVDAHLANLCRRLELASPRFPALVALFRSEIDLLLDRRRWLELTADLTGEVPADAPAAVPAAPSGRP
ncbi:hypothetical protein Acsp06_38000 [Actinomycetospora sp. NBRC 106375]|uniref:hypothetical protein n=1 Tax=Actinomycetospora sp. NBRC 106375 TaxID=3032207 RepID=UPI0024A32CF3|nr:hypothetical protein [Actinomycetospora sp. NBRC 106375]GLZ47615.1 hypothetical protein Acsp06_38000 [Actinomycetospora sp. NBRC 106375]